MAINPVLQAQWLTEICAAQSIKMPFEVGPDIKEFANGDFAGVLTPVGGYGLSDEGNFDYPTFQIRFRGREHRLADLWDLANWLDRYLIHEVGHQELWGTWVVAAGRQGSGPTPLQEDTRERRSIVCTYFAYIEL